MIKDEIKDLKIGDRVACFSGEEQDSDIYIVTGKTLEGNAILVATAAIMPYNCAGWRKLEP